MKRADFILLLVILFVVQLFVFDFYRPVGEWYVAFNAVHGYITAFIKFALLATFGEMLASRIRTGAYHPKGFGFVPRAVVWGLLGITIQFAFRVFATGVPPCLVDLGLKNAGTALQAEMSPVRVLTAFAISVVMNLIYAPVMMLIHKITDCHIQEYNGRLSAFVHLIKVREIMSERIDWRHMWSFVYKKTIPFFWIPAHTISFLLPAAYRTLFAAILGVALGLILSIAIQKPKPQTEA